MTRNKCRPEGRRYACLAAPPNPRRGGRAARLESEPCATSFLAWLPARATENAIAARITRQSCRTQKAPLPSARIDAKRGAHLDRFHYTRDDDRETWECGRMPSSGGPRVKGWLAQISDFCSLRFPGAVGHAVAGATFSDREPSGMPYPRVTDTRFWPCAPERKRSRMSCGRL
jgi:hypothetical protein